MAAENIDSFLKEKRKKNRRIDMKKVKLYGLPLLTSAIFVGIIIFLIIPKINEIFYEISVIDQLTTKQTQLQNRLAEAQRLKSNLDVLNEQNEVINSIAPSGETEVLIFRNKIQKLAEDNGLRLSFEVSNDAKLEDQIIDSTNELTLREVATQFEIIGIAPQIEEFINQLNTIDDFIIIREMSLSARTVDSISGTAGIDTEWSLELTIAKYQFNNETDEMKRAYQTIDPKAQLDSVMQQYIDRRVN